MLKKKSKYAIMAEAAIVHANVDCRDRSRGVRRIVVFLVGMIDASDEPSELN